MEFGKLLVKIARNQPLTPQEEMFLEDEGHSTQLRNSFIADNTTPQNTLRITSAMEIIFSEVFTDNKTSLTVDIPQDYNHLVIRGSGRTNQATGGRIWAQFNGDQTTNYKWVGIQGDGSGASANVFADTTAIFASLGLFATSGAAANYSSAFEATIPHYKSGFYKNVVGYTNESEQNDVYVIGSTWFSVSNISTIRFSATDNTDVQDSADMLAGSIISVYGVR